MVKLIATDMDGTLLNGKGELPAHFYEVFETLKEKGILFAAASGRQYFTLEENFKEIASDMLFIAENGTYVVYKGEALAVHPLKKEIAHELIQRGRGLGVGIILATSQGAFVECQDEAFINEVSKYYVKNQVVADLLEVKGEILKVTIYDFKGAETHSYEVYKDFNQQVQICLAGANWLDMMALGVNKGTAIKDIQHRLGISYDETMVFGDYLNDLEMLKSAYYSFAMTNAHPKVKEVARFMAKSNEEEGVMEKIKEMIER